MPMKLIIESITLPPDEEEDTIPQKLHKLYGIAPGSEWSIYKKSLDARKKNNIRFLYNILIAIDEKKALNLLKQKNIKAYIPKTVMPLKRSNRGLKILIVGFGPAGMFSALRLLEGDAEITIVEKGKRIEERFQDIMRFEQYSILDSNSNVLFGEGGAGAYSDGKLTTRTHKPEIEWFFNKMVEFGAPSSILYDSHPHLGTDQIQKVVKNIRNYLIDKGCVFKFSTSITDILKSRDSISGVSTVNEEILASKVILATGNSARNIYYILEKNNIQMDAKGFAVGFRVEHPSDYINDIQYGRSKFKPFLPAAEYNMAVKCNDKKHGVYTFCMCPGGRVINSSSSGEMLCVNGMSYSTRDTEFSNSAVVLTINPEDMQNSWKNGIDFQEMLEKNAFNAAGGGFFAPAQRISSFLADKLDGDLPNISYLPGCRPANFDSIFPSWISSNIREGLIQMNKKMTGFITDNGVCVGVETRTSSPVRIIRGRSMESVSLHGFYPVGEGAGYAGGIVSSAVDGIRAADSILNSI
jgi:hypothetical protein